MSEKNSNFNELTRFVEWRGTVSAALDYIREKLTHLHEEDLEQWKVIETIRSQQQACRDRCEKVSNAKSSKDDLITVKNDVEVCRAALVKKAESKDLKSNYDELRSGLSDKAAAVDLKIVSEKVQGQSVTQAKQAATLMFYGLIGGGLFTLLMTLFKKIIG